MKKAIIIGATSGLGQEVAKKLLNEGWNLGIAGRREAELLAFQKLSPEHIVLEQIDVTKEDASEKLFQLIDKNGGMDLFLLASGIGNQNPELNSEIEIRTAETNVVGFTRMVTSAYRFFKKQGKGHLAVISSIAGTKGLGIAPAYSATKRFQNCYIDALEQLSCMDKVPIYFTDIRPGFVATALLNDGRQYPFLMNPETVATHILKGLKQKKRVLIIDWKYRIIVFFWRVIPRSLWKKMPVRTKSK